MANNEFTLQDFMSQIAQVGKSSETMRLVRDITISSKDLQKHTTHLRGIYHSMSIAERQAPILLDGRRRRRIAVGAGVTLSEVGQFLRQFEMSRNFMQSTGSFTGMRKLKIVLGLVTDDPSLRDPSWVYPLIESLSWRLLLVSMLIALSGVALLRLFALLTH
jgi:signal recognition particle GTPase